MSILVALDPALSYTGISVKDTDNDFTFYIDTICTKYGDIKNQSEDERILFICKKIIKICKDLKVDKVIVEDQFVGATNKKTAMQLSRLRGALMVVVKLNGVDFEVRNTNSINKSLEKMIDKSQIIKEKDVDKKIKTYMYIKEIHKECPLVSSIGEFNDKACKEKNSDKYDAVAIMTIYESN